MIEEFFHPRISGKHLVKPSKTYYCYLNTKYPLIKILKKQLETSLTLGKAVSPSKVLYWSIFKKRENHPLKLKFWHCENEMRE